VKLTFQEHEALTRAMVAAAQSANVSTHGSIEGRAAFRSELASRCIGGNDAATGQLVVTAAGEGRTPAPLLDCEVAVTPLPSASARR